MTELRICDRCQKPLEPAPEPWCAVKQTYPTEDAASAAIEEMGGAAVLDSPPSPGRVGLSVRPHRCPYCAQWHLYHAVVRVS